MERVIVLDGGNVLHKAIFAFRNNYAVPATYTYMRMIIGYLKKLKVTPEDKIIIAQDFGSWRKDFDKNYKSQRRAGREKIENREWWKEMYGEFNDFFPKLKKSLPWYFLKIYRIEADDIASVACRYYKDNEVILISSDKDWEMLMNYPNVKIFSTITKKFKEVKNPMKVLLDKIQGDISDNLLDRPSSEMDYEIRKKIVNLLDLPLNIEIIIKEQLDKLLPKNLHLAKVPYRTVQKELKKLYGYVE